MNVLHYISKNPDIPLGTLALAMGLKINEDGLRQASNAKGHALKFLKLPMSKRVSKIDAMGVAARQVGIGFGKIEVGMNDQGQYPEGQTQGHMMVESGLNIDGNPTKLDMFDGTIIDQRLRVATYVFDVTSNRDAILRTEARRSI